MRGGRVRADQAVPGAGGQHHPGESPQSAVGQGQVGGPGWFCDKPTFPHREGRENAPGSAAC